RPAAQFEGGGVGWVGRGGGTDAKVTEVPFAVSTAFLVTQKFWRDLEFWNKSVRYAAHDPTDAYRDAVVWFPADTLTVDPNDGRANRTFTPYVVQSVGETRFRIAGNVILQRPDVMLIRAAMPWRADWASSGLYDDGWTRPGTPAHIRVFAPPDQQGPVTRTLTLQLRAPEDVEQRAFSIAWRGGSTGGTAGGASSVSTPVQVCVP